MKWMKKNGQNSRISRSEFPGSRLSCMSLGLSLRHFRPAGSRLKRASLLSSRMSRGSQQTNWLHFPSKETKTGREKAILLPSGSTQVSSSIKHTKLVRILVFHCKIWPYQMHNNIGKQYLKAPSSDKIHMLLLSSKLMLLFKLLQFIQIEFNQNYGWTFLDDAAGVWILLSRILKGQ